jgi:hypothetical protein
VPLPIVDVLVRAKFVIVCLCNPDPFTITISNSALKTDVVVAAAVALVVEEVFVCLDEDRFKRFDLQWPERIQSGLLFLSSCTLDIVPKSNFPPPGYGKGPGRTGGGCAIIFGFTELNVTAVAIIIIRNAITTTTTVFCAFDSLDMDYTVHYTPFIRTENHQGY